MDETRVKLNVSPNRRSYHIPGQLVINLVCRDAVLRDSILASLKRLFKHVANVRLYEEVNEVVFACDREAPYSPEALEAAAKGLNAAARARSLVSVKCVDLKDFLQSLTILS